VLLPIPSFDTEGPRTRRIIKQEHGQPAPGQPSGIINLWVLGAESESSTLDASMCSDGGEAWFPVGGLNYEGSQSFLLYSPYWHRWAIVLYPVSHSLCGEAYCGSWTIVFRMPSSPTDYNFHLRDCSVHHSIRPTICGVSRSGLWSLWRSTLWFSQCGP
jgi:hypothetical protein